MSDKNISRYFPAASLVTAAVVPASIAATGAVGEVGTIPLVAALVASPVLGGAMLYREGKEMLSEKNSGLSRVFSGVAAATGGMNLAAVTYMGIYWLNNMGPTNNYVPPGMMALFAMCASTLVLQGISGIAGLVAQSIRASAKKNDQVPPTVPPAP